MAKRPLAALVAFFVAGIIITMLDISIFLTAAVFIICAAYVIYIGQQRLLLLLAMVFMILLGGICTNIAEKKRDSVLRSFSAQSKNLTMTVTEFSDEGKVICEFLNEEKPVRVYLSIKEYKELSPGDVIEAEVSLREPYSGKVGIADFSGYLSSRGIYLYGYADSVNVTARHTQGIKGAVYSLRRYINEIGERSFTGDIRALFNAMVLGDKRLMSDELYTALQKAGLNHIAVVSGMHLSVIITLQMLIINSLFGKRRAGNLLAILGAIFITLVTGAGASVVRACVMCVIYQLSQLFYRESDAPTSLMCSVGIMAAVNPYIILNAGFVLSAASVGGIILFNSKVGSFMKKFIPGQVGESAAVCISAQLLVTPLVIYYFGIITPYSILSNVLVSFFASALVIAGMIFCIISHIPAIGSVCSFLIELFAGAVSVVCDGISRLPGAAVNMERLTLNFLIVWVLLLVLIYTGAKNLSRTAAICVAFVIVFFTGTIFQQWSKSGINMFFIPYGAGSMTAAFLPDGEAILADCHNYSDALELAASNKKEKYDYMLLTTNSLWEAEALAERSGIAVAVAYAPLFSEEEAETAASVMKKHGVHMVFLNKGERFGCKSAIIEYMTFETQENEAVGLKIEYKGKEFVTLQGMESKSIEKLCNAREQIMCDYLYMPFAAFHSETVMQTLSYGKIIQYEREITIK